MVRHMSPLTKAIDSTEPRLQTETYVRGPNSEFIESYNAS